MTQLAESIKVVDTDAHVSEPADLWTSRLPKRWRADAPRVDDGVWYLGTHRMTPVGLFAAGGWKEYLPSNPPSLEEADPAVYDPAKRIERMDDFGIYAQVLYPNILGFESFAFMEHQDAEFSSACVSAYNDYITEFASTDPDRLLPITVLPFWDVAASVTEMRRCAGMGHRGILFANKYENAGLPVFTDRHWDPIFDAASELGLAINFHVSFASMSRTADSADAELLKKLTTRTQGARAGEAPTTDLLKSSEPNLIYDFVQTISGSLLGNAPTIISLLMSDVCDRYPELNFVSVESGMGYVPYLLEGLDWNWHTYGGPAAFPNRLLPSEYFRRQCYGTFWFEKVSLAMLSEYPDNFMFETDFPHGGSLTPGPCSFAEVPSVHIEHQMAGVPPEVARKALFGNAARIYNIPS